MKNFEILNYALKSNHDAMFGDEIDLIEKEISDHEINTFVINLLKSDFLNVNFIGNINKSLKSRDKISDKWCSTYNRSEIAHYDLLLSAIDFINGNKRKLIDIIFYISNIYASQMIGNISSPTIEIKNKFHEFSYVFRKQLVNLI